MAARTGYPTDMLDPDLDVEADLSIDSIKRMEILAELADEIGLSDDGSLDQLEDLVEDLAKNKTLRSIVGFLVGHADQLTSRAAAGGRPRRQCPRSGARRDVAPAASSASNSSHRAANGRGARQQRPGLDRLGDGGRRPTGQQGGEPRPISAGNIGTISGTARSRPTATATRSA